MNISFSSILIGLCVGAVAGYGAAQFVSRDTTTTSQFVDERSTNSNSTPVRTSSQDKKSVLLKSDSVEKVASQKTNSSSAHSSALDLDRASLRNHQPFSQGFSEELELMNKIAGASFEQLESLGLELVDEPSSGVWGTRTNLSLIGLRMLEFDRDKTFAFLQSTMPTQGRGYSIQNMHEIVAGLATTHHAELLEWTASINNRNARQQIQGMVFAGMTTVDPEAAIALYEQYSPVDSADNIYPILATWASVDPQAAMEWAVNKIESGDDRGYREMIYMQWLEIDQNSANLFLANVTDPEFKAQLESQSIMALANSDPQAALEQAMSMDSSQSRSMAIEMAMYSWGEISIIDAIDYATYSLEGAEQQQAFNVLGNAASMHGGNQLGDTPMEIMNRADSLPDGLRQSIRMNTMHAFFTQDPDGAMQWLDSVSDQQERESLIGAFAWEIPQYDLAMAQSLYQQSDETTRSMLAPGIAQKLYESDPAAAWNWHQQLTNESTRNDVFMSLVHNEAQTNPDEAMRLAMSASTGENEHFAFGVFSSVAYENPEWAVQWLEQASLDDETRTQMQMMLDEAQSYPRDYYQTQYQIEHPDYEQH